MLNTKKLTYLTHQKNDDINEYNDDLDDFFELNNQVETDSFDNNSIEEVILYNELENIVERVATEKEHNLFLLLSNGVSFEKAGSIFGVKSPRAKQMFNELLNKLP